MVIEPYVGVGPIKFGMDEAGVAEALGSPVRKVQSQFGTTNYEYDTFQVILSEKDCSVAEIGFDPSADLWLAGIDLFNSPDAFARVVALDGRPCEFLGFIILLNLGITMTGFHDNDESQKAVTAFARGRWDGFRDRMKPFALDG